MSGVAMRALGTTGLQVSEVGFGALEIGRDWAADVNADPRHLRFEDAERLLHGVLDLGVNFVDTAPAYGLSEEYIGRALAGRRSEYVLATKVGERWDPAGGSVYDYSADGVRASIERSLQLLRTDVIDLVQIHSASREVLERGETLGALEEARAAGKVRFVGMTGGVAEATRALELGGYDTVQFPYNLLNLAAEVRLLGLAGERGAGVILMRPLAGGKLSGKFERLEKPAAREAVASLVAFTEGGTAEELAGLALRYVLGAREVSTVIAGTRRLDAVRANLAAAARGLEPAARERLRAHAAGLDAGVW
ncbi:MAG: aldo/keto reductase [Candidatus Sumerlaeia bacterium]|nr:aldo/keto reductase [Candidatus Sumerlaeia bacterium]